MTNRRTKEERAALCEWFRAEYDRTREAGYQAGLDSVGDLCDDMDGAEAEIARLRKAIEYALEDASVEGRLRDGRAAYVAIGMTAYQGLVDALSSPKEAERP